MALPSVFIIDPVFTSLLLAGVITAWALRRRLASAVRANRILLGLGVLYLIIGISGHMVVRARGEVHPQFQGKALHVQSAPFSIVFWQVLGIDDATYVTGLTSLFGSCPISDISNHPRLAQAPAAFLPAKSVRHELRRSLACPNIVENALGTVRQVTRNVKRWRHAEMALRWTAAGLLEAQKTFRRLKAYRQLPILRNALQEHLRKAQADSAIETIMKAA